MVAHRKFTDARISQFIKLSSSKVGKINDALWRTIPKGLVLYIDNGNGFNDTDLIQKVIEPYILTFTQKQAGFTTEVMEEVLTVQMKDSTYNVIELLKRDRVVIGKKGEVLADTAVKLQQKIHQNL
jgi:hypothetical protein